MTWKIEHDDEEIMYMLDVSNENIWGLNSSDSCYEVTDPDVGESGNGTSDCDVSQEWHQ
jgi:hypothetical protein